MTSIISQIQKRLTEDVLPEDLDSLKSILRTEHRYGRNELERIKNPINLYDSMLKKGTVSKNNHDKLLSILREADLHEVEESIEKVIEEHLGRPTSLPCNTNKRAQPQDDASSKRKKYSENEFGSGGSLVSPDGIVPGFKYPDHSTRVYDLDPNRKGLVLMINNFTIEGQLYYRSGTLEDEKRIKDLFTSSKFEAHYKVKSAKRNLCYDSFNNALKEWARKLKEKDSEYNSLILFIMSHGEKDGVKTFYSTENEPDHCVISIDHITNTFKDCLKGRPKVFMIQACQGMMDNQEEDAEPDAISPGAGLAQPVETTGEENAEEVETDQAMKLSTPPDAADMLTAIATVKGYRSYRSGKASSKGCGAWFIKDFIDQVYQLHSNELYSSHLLDIITEMQYQVAERKGRTPIYSDGVQTPKKVQVRQMPCFQSTMRKKFYLLPPNLPSTYQP